MYQVLEALVYMYEINKYIPFLLVLGTIMLGIGIVLVSR